MTKTDIKDKVLKGDTGECKRFDEIAHQPT
jgi:hypothetical protein